MEWKCDSVPPIMESMRINMVVDSASDSHSATMIATIAAVVPIIILAAVVVTLLIVVVTAVIDNRQQQLLSSKQQRNSQRRGSSTSRGALIDIGLLWSALCCTLSLAINKDKDNAVEQTQQQQQQHQSAKKIRKSKNNARDHVILERIVS